MKSLGKYIYNFLTLLLGVCVFVFWKFGHPEALSFQEQNQLFLWTYDYFCNAVSVPGGLADWMGDFLVQFYYIEWLGATILALLFMLFQGVVACLFRLCPKIMPWLASLFGILLSLFLLWIMGDENVMLSFPLAITSVLMLARATRRLCWYYDVAIVPVLYWLFGPAVWFYVVISIVIKRDKFQVLIPLMLAVLQFAAAHTVLEQWPLSKVLTGTGYYRNFYFSAEQFSFGYDSDKYSLLRQDYLIRNERWQDIIKEAEKHQVEVNFSSEAINLALAMTGQLADRQFSFYQSGPDALLMPMVRDNVSNLPTMEAFYRLGMVNESMRYAFDIQESILNGKKSGRLMKRIAECCIINGRYATAEKYLDMLEKSLFYRSWAKKAKTYLGNETWINTHPEWGRIRQLRYKDDFLFNHPEMDTMLGILFQENPKNRMALEYFLGQMLLNGNLKGFCQYLQWAQQSGFYQSMPVGYNDAWQCIQAKGNLPGSPFAAYAKRMNASKADGVSGASQLSNSIH